MHPTQPETDFAPIQRALGALFVVGRHLLGLIAAGATAALPKPFARRPASAERRVARALEWLAALAATLAGDRTWLRVPTYIFPRFPGRYPALTAELRASIGLPPVPPATEATKAAARLRYMRRVFATQSTARIAARIARRLGVTEAAPAWPHALLAQTDPPASRRPPGEVPPAAPRNPAPPAGAPPAPTGPP